MRYILWIVLSVVGFRSQFTPVDPCLGLPKDRCLRNCFCGWCYNSTSDHDERCLEYVYGEKCENQGLIFESHHSSQECEKTVSSSETFLIVLTFLILAVLIGGMIGLAVYLHRVFRARYQREVL
jgi:hypothetical protein